jgi:transposase
MAPVLKGPRPQDVKLDLSSEGPTAGVLSWQQDRAWQSVRARSCALSRRRDGRSGRATVRTDDGRVLQDSDEGMPADAVAAKYRVSRSWVDRLKQRRRETGEIAPRRQTRWRTPILTPDLPRLETLINEQPDRTLAELQAGLGTSASLATIWRTIERLEITIKKTSWRGGRRTTY